LRMGEAGGTAGEDGCPSSSKDRLKKKKERKHYSSIVLFFWGPRRIGSQPPMLVKVEFLYSVYQFKF
jgi:hypothetical protein